MNKQDVKKLLSISNIIIEQLVYILCSWLKFVPFNPLLHVGHYSVRMAKISILK